VRYAGMDVTVHSSDEKRAAGKLSRQRPPVLRWAAFEVAKRAWRKGSPDHDYYLKNKERIGANRAALSIARKLIRRAHHTLRMLKVAGETNRPVLPLKVPARQRELTVADLEGFESARLFLDRAWHRNPSFVLMSENAQAVTEVCRRLEGIPLALELAAARVGVLSIEQISEMLENSLGHLTSGNQTEVPRRRTLRGTMDWSYELLSEPEQRLFERLSVFSGGWDLETARAISSRGNIDESDVLELTSKLVDKSLLVAEANGRGGTRFRMLEPVRQYARERLEQSGEAEEFGRRHTEYFLRLAEETEAKLLGPEQGTWLRRLESEHDNFRMALSWAFARGDAELGLRLSSALFRFWARRGHFHEGQGWLERGLVEKCAVSMSTQAAGLDTLGMLVESQGDLELASTLYEEALTLHQGLDDDQNIADCQYHLGSLAIVQGDYDRATDFLEGGLRCYRRLADAGGVAHALTHLAMTAYAQSDEYEQASQLLEEALLLYAESGDTWGGAFTLGELGWVMVLRGDYMRAAQLLEDALARVRRLGVRQASANLLTRLALAVLGRGDHERATGLLREGLVLSRELITKLETAHGIEGMAIVAAAEKRADRAGRLWGAAEVSREAMGAPLRPDERRIYEPYITIARAEFANEAWEANREEGRQMTLEEAADYALDKVEPVTLTNHAPARSSSAQWPVSLTLREEQVTVLVARGLTNRQIAAELSISEHTAATHVRRILKKLGLQSRAQIGSWLSEQHLSPLDTD
jgi:predicted ATPase/DNA-binding CsgD family transcriptional regulator